MLGGLIASAAFAALLPFAALFIMRAVARRMERRAVVQPGGERGSGPDRRTLLWLMALALVLPLPAAAATGGWRAVAGLGGLLLFLAALVLHSVPGHRRSVKYGLIVAGSAGLPALSGGSRTPLRLAEGAEHLARLFDSVEGIGLLVHFVVTMGASVFVLHWIRPDRVPPDEGTPRALRVYRYVSVIQGPDVNSALMFLVLNLVGLGPSYVLLRFGVKAKLQKAPFVFLRSFGHPEAARVFSKIVAPALVRKGAFEGLVHASQTSTDLQGEVPLLWRSNFETVGDEGWREWVTDALDRCRGVIIDVSGATPGVQWELEQARARLAPEQILVIRSRGAEPVPDAGETLEYDLQHDLEPARSAVAAWGAASSARLGFEDPKPNAASRIRWSLPPVGVAAFYSCALLALTIPAFTYVIKVGDRHDKGMRTMAEIRAREVLTRQRFEAIDSKRDLRCDQVRANARATEDPWGTPMDVSCVGDRIRVRSAGPDESFDTEDDVIAE